MGASRVDEETGEEMSFNPQPKRKYKKRKKPRVSSDSSVKKRHLGALWTDCIKARAKYQSELSGVKGIKAGGLAIITAHHILGKDTNRLRYSLDNGVCLVNGKEHIFGVHNTNPVIASEYFDRIISSIGEKRYKKIRMLQKAKVGSSDLGLIKYYLTEKLKEFKQ